MRFYINLLSAFAGIMITVVGVGIVRRHILAGLYSWEAWVMVFWGLFVAVGTICYMLKQTKKSEVVKQKVA